MVGGIEPSVRANTFDRYDQYIRLHGDPALGKLALAKSQPQRIQHLYASRLDAGALPTRVAHPHAVLPRAFVEAAKMEPHPGNVAAVAGKPHISVREVATYPEGNGDIPCARPADALGR